MADLVDITKDRLKQLLDAEAKLSCLEECGVEDWKGYDSAMELYKSSLINCCGHCGCDAHKIVKKPTPTEIENIFDKIVLKNVKLEKLKLYTKSYLEEGSIKEGFFNYFIYEDNDDTVIYVGSLKTSPIKKIIKSEKNLIEFETQTSLYRITWNE